MSWRPSLGALAALAVLAVGAPASPAVDVDPEAFYLVRWSARITDASHAEAEAAGAQIIAYQHPDSYIVWAPKASSKAMRALDGVVSVSRSPIEGTLDPRVGGASGVVIATVISYGPATQGLLDDVAGMGTVLWTGPRGRNGALWATGVQFPAARASDLAADPRVLWVGEYPGPIALLDEKSSQIQAGSMDERRFPWPGYRDWLSSLGIDGSGVRVALVDSGVDSQHPALAHRIARHMGYSVAGRMGLDPYGHGTAVAGALVGDPDGIADLADPQGFSYGLGVAPGADLVVLDFSEDALARGAEGPPPSLFSTWT